MFCIEFEFLPHTDIALLTQLFARICVSISNELNERNNNTLINETEAQMCLALIYLRR